MANWREMALVAAATVAVIVSVFCFCCLRRLIVWRRRSRHVVSSSTPRLFLSPIARELGNKARVMVPSPFAYPSPCDKKLCFDWRDHPSLIAEAVEHGWAKFGFVYGDGSANVTPLWPFCCGHLGKEAAAPAISWEISGAASDYVQKIRLNPTNPPVQTLCAALPLPGPFLGPLSFPQEAYFEITIIPTESVAFRSHESVDEHEKTKLIDTNLAQLLLLSPLPRRSFPSAIAELSPSFFALGLAANRGTLCKPPGFDSASVGFHSNGHVYLNGALHLSEVPNPNPPSLLKQRWPAVDGTFGCGFEPSSKRVFFTLDGELVCEILTSGREFGSPLYPAIAANCDITVSANFGQSLFKYAPANACRIAEPCFKRMSAKNSTTCEDSGELFSIGRLDSQCFESPCSQDWQRCAALSETESDLFEIVLDAKI